MKWVNILHLYQPPTQTREIVGEVAKESYEKIIALLDEYPHLKLTVNISGSLLELLSQFGFDHVIKGLKRHADRRAVEFLGSAMYHPILPLLSEKEILRQIRLNEDISRKCFGGAFAPSGFYLPEMAYSESAAKAIAKAGYKWIILDEVHAKEKIDFDTKYKIKGLPLNVIFRNSSYSRTFPPESIVKDLGKLNGDYIVTCHDGELYGHWHKDDRGYYAKAFNDPSIETITVSEYLKELKKEAEISIRDASWESTKEELDQNISLGLWNDPRNKIHVMLEDFKREVLTLVDDHQRDENFALARYHADRGVASCAWWWASERRIGPFSPLTWNPTEIEKGAKELLSAAKALSLSIDDESRISARFKELRETIWSKHKRDYDPGFSGN